MLTPCKKSYDQPRQHIKKQRHYFVNKDLSSRGYLFQVNMYGCESWTIKKAEHQQIDALELWCWRRLLRVPWTVRRSNQFILKEISPGCSLEGLMLKLKLQYFGHLMRRADSLEKTLMLGKIESRRRRGWQRMRWLDHQLNGNELESTPVIGDGQGGLPCCSPWGHKQLDMTEWLNWTEPNPVFWPGEFHGLYSPGGSQRVRLNGFQQLNDFHFTFTLYLAPIK